MAVHGKKVIALLPMKGHSERVPNKNLKIFNGKPLYQRVLKTLLSCDLIDEVLINTDGDKIKKDIELNFKNERIVIHDRPKSIKGDYVSMNKIIEYDLNNSSADIYLQTHSTNPLIKLNSIKRGIESYEKILKDNLYDSIFSVTKIQSRFYTKECKPLNHNPNELLRTQDLPPLFEENSCLYLFNKKSFQKSKNKRIGLSPKMLEINPLEVIDIDTLEDFLIAEAIHKLKI